MPIHLTADDAREPPPDWKRMLWRGFTRRCPRCGERRVFRTWWSIKERCPRCGMAFIREEGYFTGVYLLNLALVLAVLFVMAIAFAIWLSENPGASLVPALLVGALVAVVLPVVGYPFARTTWAALDLLMTPMELDEIAEAAAIEVDGFPADDGPPADDGGLAGDDDVEPDADD